MPNFNCESLHFEFVPSGYSMGFNGYSICFNMFQPSKSWAETVVKSCFGVDNCAMNSEFNNCLEYENANSEAMDIYGRYLWIHMDIYIFG